MIVYVYELDDEINKQIFKETLRCQLNPVNKSEYLKPANSTTEAPYISADKIAYWEDNQWKYMDNFRIKKYYSIEDSSKIEYPEYEKLDTYTTEETVYKFSIFDKEENKWTPDLEKYKDYIKKELTDRIDANQAKYADIILENGETIEINCCIKSLNAINSLIQYIEASGNNDKTVKFRLYDNTMMDLGIDDLKICSEKIMDIYQNTLQSKWKIKDDIALLSKFNEIEEYAINNDVDIYLKDENGNYIYPLDSIKLLNDSK